MAPVFLSWLSGTPSRRKPPRRGSKPPRPRFLPAVEVLETRWLLSAATTTSLAFDYRPALYGQSVTVTATVTNLDTSATPAGSVTFADAGSSLGSSAVSGSGTTATASWGLSALSVGSHSISAIFTPANDCFAASSVTMSEEVNPASTSTSLVVDNNPSQYGQSVSLTAGVTNTSSGATPDGCVTFYDGATSLGAPPVSGSGSSASAGLSVSSLGVGSHTITAVFMPSSSFNASSESLTEVVNAASTSTALTVDTDPSLFGQGVSLTATVTNGGSSVTPDGSLEFYDGATDLGGGSVSGSTNSASASLTVSTLPAGSHTISAVFTSSGSFTTSSNSLTQVVNPASVSTSLSVSTSMAVFGQTVTATALQTNLSTGVAPSGTVLIKEGTVCLGSATLSGGGTTASAALGISTLSVGSHTISEIVGSSNFVATSTATATVSITPATPTVDLTITGGAFTGLPFNATVSLTGVSGTSTSLEGVSPSLTYHAGSSGGGPTLPGAPTLPGTYTVVGSFPGSSDYTCASASATFTITPNETLPGDALSDDTTQGTWVQDDNAQVSPQTGGPTVQAPLRDGCGCGLPPDLGLIDSQDSTVQPIIQTLFATDSGGSLPTSLSVQLTWNGTTQSAVTFTTTGDSAGDTLVLDTQVSTPVSTTGAYSWQTLVIATYPGGSQTAGVASGVTAVAVSGSGGSPPPLGYGWDDGADVQLVSTSGGVVMVDSQGGTEYFTGPASGGVYTSPANDLGTLVLNGDGTYTYTALDQSQVTFNSSGQVTAELSADGVGYTFSYGTYGVTAITQPDGSVVTFAYDGSGLVQTITEPGGAVVTLTHDGSGNLTGLAFPDGGLSTFSYDAGHKLTSEAQGTSLTTYSYDSTSGLLTEVNRGGGATLGVVAAAGQGLATSPAHKVSAVVGVLTDALGGVTTYTMDDQGRPTQLVGADSSTQQWSYNSQGQVTTATDALGHTTTYSYNATTHDLTEVTFADSSTVQYQYDATFHEPTVIVDPLGNRTTNSYDAGTGDLLTTKNALNQVTTYTWSSGLLQTVTDALNHTTTYQYDGNHHLQVVIDPAGDRTTYGYDAAGDVTTVTDALNHTTTYQYDAMGRQTVVIDPLGNRTTVTNDTRGHITSVTDALNHTTTFQYDALGRETVKIDPLGDRTTYGYDAAGDLTTVTDALNHTTTFQYDAMGRQTVVIDPLGDRTTVAYDAAGDVTSVKDALNHTTTYQYDAVGQRTVTIDALGNRTTVAYDAVGDVSTVTDALNHTTTYQYDAAGRQTVTIDALGNRTTVAYDAVGDVSTVTDALNHTTTYQYDAVGRQTVVIDALGNRTTTAYDAVSDVTSVTNALNHTTTYQYDALGRQTVTIDALSERTTVAYDAVGNVTAVTDADNNTTTFAYDALNRKVGQTDQLGDTTTYAYNAVGLMTGTTDPLGRVIDSTYDADNRLTGQTWLNTGGSTQNTLTYTYDAVDNLLTAANNNGVYTLTYDALNRAATVAEPFGVALTFSYDAVGNRTEVQDSLGGVVSSTYDAESQLTSRVLSGTAGPNLTINLGYDAVGDLTGATRYTAGVMGAVGSTSLTYDAVGAVATMQNRDGSGSSIGAYTYTYDAAGELTSEVDNGTTTSYSYDATGQLTAAGAAAYAYDATGNRTGTGVTVDTGNQLQSDGTYNYTNDAAGNEITKTDIATEDKWTYGYDDLNEMVSAVETASGGAAEVEVTYKYDVFGNRIEKDVTVVGPDATTTTRYAYDGWNPAKAGAVGTSNFDIWATLDGSSSLTMRYLDGDTVDQVFARVDGSGSAAWLDVDHLGSVRAVTDGSGTLLAQVNYDAFGNASVTGTDPSAVGIYQWTGREYDGETGLQYNRARYYDPGTGRWLAQDPMGFDAGDSNLYRYVKNEPANTKDPSGKDLIILMGTDIKSQPGNIKVGHPGVLIGNDKTGWDYWSFHAGKGTTVKDNVQGLHFDTLNDAKKDPALSEYNWYIKIPDDKKGGQDLLAAHEVWLWLHTGVFGVKTYILAGQNCASFAHSVATAFLGTQAKFPSYHGIAGGRNWWPYNWWNNEVGPWAKKNGYGPYPWIPIKATK